VSKAKKTPTRKLAERIARDLFTNAFSQVGTRLAIMLKHRCGHEDQLGGWCERAAIDRIENTILLTRKD
jgi:hypothetical protein